MCLATVLDREKRRKFIYIKQLFVVIISSGLLACATTDRAAEGSNLEESPRKSNCISDGTIRDYRILDNSNLIVTAAGRRKYHMVISRPAYGLKSSWRLGFIGSAGRICSGFGQIVVNQGGFGPEKIRISTIVLISPEDEDELLIRFGKKEPEFEEPRVPEEVEGAGAEELD